MDPTTTARSAILADLKRRYAAKDPGVHPMDSRNSHRWFHPQENYFWGGGSIVCPVCGNGHLIYSRSGHNGHVRAQCSTENCLWWQE